MASTALFSAQAAEMSSYSQGTKVTAVAFRSTGKTWATVEIVETSEGLFAIKNGTRCRVRRSDREDYEYMFYANNLTYYFNY